MKYVHVYCKGDLIHNILWCLYTNNVAQHISDISFTQHTQNIQRSPLVLHHIPSGQPQTNSKIDWPLIQFEKKTKQWSQNVRSLYIDIILFHIACAYNKIKHIHVCKIVHSIHWCVYMYLIYMLLKKEYVQLPISYRICSKTHWNYCN